MYLNRHICYSSGSDTVEQWIVQLPSNAMVTRANLHWQTAETKEVYTGEEINV